MTLWDSIVLIVSLAVTFRLALLVALSVVDLRRRRLHPLPTEGDLPPLSVIVPAFNEEAVIAGTIRALKASDHPDFELSLIHI